MQRPDRLPEYVPYLGRMVVKNHFAAFVYKSDGTSTKLVNNYDEFLRLIETGEWIAEKHGVSNHDADS